MRCGRIESVNVGIFDKFGIGSIGFGGGGIFIDSEELLGSIGKRGGSSYDGMLYIRDLTN